jgi:hypothetical protein
MNDGTTTAGETVRVKSAADLRMGLTPESSSQRQMGDARQAQKGGATDGTGARQSGAKRASTAMDDEHQTATDGGKPVELEGSASHHIGSLQDGERPQAQ